MPLFSAAADCLLTMIMPPLHDAAAITLPVIFAIMLRCR